MPGLSPLGSATSNPGVCAVLACAHGASLPSFQGHASLRWHHAGTLIIGSGGAEAPQRHQHRTSTLRTACNAVLIKPATSPAHVEGSSSAFQSLLQLAQPHNGCPKHDAGQWTTAPHTVSGLAAFLLRWRSLVAASPRGVAHQIQHRRAGKGGQNQNLCLRVACIVMSPACF